MERGSIISRPEAGAKVLYATSNDPKFPATAIIDGKEDTAWMTTGMYPQEFIITLGSTVSLSNVQTMMQGAKKVSLHRSDRRNAGVWAEVTSWNYDNAGDTTAQLKSIPLREVAARHLKFVIHDGFGPFTAVSQVDVTGAFVE